MSSLHHTPRVQPGTSNRPESAIVPLVGETAVRLARHGLAPRRVAVPPVLDGIAGRTVRARRDDVGALGEFRAVALEDDRLAVASVAFLPRPGTDLGVFGAEIVQSGHEVVGSFGVYAGAGTWFAGQHAAQAHGLAHEMFPALVPEPEPGARARQQGYAIQVRLGADGGARVEALHRLLWDAFVATLDDALTLDAGGTERHVRALDAWKAHRRTAGVAVRALEEAGARDAARLFADVVTA